jgi:hypothetical protein
MSCKEITFSWNDHFLCRNSFLKHVIEGKVEKKRDDGKTKKKT